jgi:hypothetical protein
MAFIIHFTGVLSYNLDGYFWAMGEWLKKW